MVTLITKRRDPSDYDSFVLQAPTLHLLDPMHQTDVTLLSPSDPAHMVNPAGFI